MGRRRNLCHHDTRTEMEFNHQVNSCPLYSTADSDGGNGNVVMTL